jgi:hypothetical protein
MSFRLRCLGCGHRIELDETYQDYDGPLRCWTCEALFVVVLCEGRLRGMRRVEDEAREV